MSWSDLTAPNDLTNDKCTFEFSPQTHSYVHIFSVHMYYGDKKSASINYKSLDISEQQKHQKVLECFNL